MARESRGYHFSVPTQIVSAQPSNEEAAVNVSISQFGVKNRESEVSAVAVLKNWGSVSTEVEANLFADSQIVRTDKLQLKAGEQKSLLWKSWLMPMCTSFK